MIEIRGARLGPTGAAINVVISGKKIKAISAAGKTSEYPIDKVIDADGLIIAPGLIDPHVHFRVPGSPHKEDWETGSRAAVKGGVTTVFDMPNTEPPTITSAALAEKRLLAKNSLVNARFWFGATENNLPEIAKAARERDVVGVKLYLAPTTGSLCVDDEKVIRKILETCAKLNIVVAVHAEDRSTIESNLASLTSQKGEPTIWDHGKIRSADSSRRAINRILAIQQETKCRIYFCHLTRPEDIELVYASKIKTQKQEIFSEVCIPHLNLCRIPNLLDIPELRKLEALHKINPPLPDVSEIDLLRKLVFSGRVDVLATDHAPHTLTEKLAEKYSDIPSGMPGVEWFLPLSYQYVIQNQISYDQFTLLTSGNVSRIFGDKIGKRGKISPGYFADIVLIEELGVGVKDNSGTLSKCGWNPYEHIPMSSRAMLTMVEGKIVWDIAGLSRKREI